jgi:hypothetical protein
MCCTSIRKYNVKSSHRHLPPWWQILAGAKIRIVPILKDSSTKESIMRELIFAVSVAVIAGIVQAVLTGLWSHLACAVHIFCS